jgi:5-methylcytosine-specific restriction enzyme subunit McrC
VSQEAKHITVFEHDSIKLNQTIDNVLIDNKLLTALERYHGEKGVPYYSLIYNGVKFNEYVGVIQIGNNVIEVLPKVERTYTGINEKRYWRDILIDMLLTIGAFEVHSTSHSSLKIKPNSILDLYFELFINEVEYLLHNGLVSCQL